MQLCFYLTFKNALCGFMGTLIIIRGAILLQKVISRLNHLMEILLVLVLSIQATEIALIFDLL